jgi:short-subunit dehydrogenase
MDFVRFDEQDPGMIQRLIQVNVEVPLQMTRYVLPQMIERRHGRIVNIGSMFGSIGFSCFTAYSASKFALRGFARDVYFGGVYARSGSNSGRSFHMESDDLTA